MTLLNVSALYTKTILSLLIASGLSLLSGCSGTPSSVRTDPPRIECEAGPASLIPPLPDTQALESEWIVTVLGLYQGEVEKRKAIRQCLAELREQGVIR